MTGAGRDLTGILPELAAFVPHLPDLALDDPVAARRAGAELVRRAAAAAGPPDSSGLEVVEDLVTVGEAPAVPVTRYQPDSPSGGPRPAVVVVHGGGFVMGDRASVDAECRKLARTLGAVVVNPEYRLAPEHRAPAAVEDVYAVLAVIAAHPSVDAERVAIVGSSAGAGIAAGVALAARERGGPALALQVLDNPALDDRLGTLSSRQFTATPMWDRRKCEQMWDLYLGADRGQDVSHLAAPARAADLSGLPPTYLMTAQYDPLRDEGLEYARRLLEAGVPVELHCVPGAFHGFTALPAEVSARALGWRTDALARALAGPAAT